MLIIDDDPSLLESYTVLLEDEFQVHTATTGEAGLTCLQREAIDLLLLDLRLPEMDGLEVLRRVKVLDAQVPVIVITAVNEVRCAAQAFKLGAVDYLVKPVDIDTTLTVLRCTLARHGAIRSTLVTPAETAVPRVLDVLVGQSAPMRQLATLISRVADTDATVLITGESGTGKELVAQVLHQQSHRRSGPFVAVHCGAIPTSLAESVFPLLVRHFLAQYNQRFGRQVPGMTWEALAVLGRYAWPGNVLEWEHVIERLVATSRPHALDVPDLPPELPGYVAPCPAGTRRPVSSAGWPLGRCCVASLGSPQRPCKR